LAIPPRGLPFHPGPAEYMLVSARKQRRSVPSPRGVPRVSSEWARAGSWSGLEAGRQEWGREWEQGRTVARLGGVHVVADGMRLVMEVSRRGAVSHQTRKEGHDASGSEEPKVDSSAKVDKFALRL
jgi:hypothetical protein